MPGRGHVRRLSTYILLFIAILTSGCVSKFYPPHDNEHSKVIPPGAFTGITNEDTDRIIVVHVHGISCHDPGYSSYLQYEMANKLGLDTTGDRLRESLEIYQWDYRNDQWYETLREDFAYGIEVPASLPGRFGIDDAQHKRKKYSDRLKSSTLGELRQCKGEARAGGETVGQELQNTLPSILIRRFSDTGSTATLTYIEVTWSPISENEKQERLEFDKLKAPDRQWLFWTDRAFANGLAKEAILNEKISDAIYYLGPGGGQIKTFFQGAFCLAAGGSALPKSFNPVEITDPCITQQGLDRSPRNIAYVRPQTVFISESVGSRILFDTIVNTDTVLDEDMAEIDLKAAAELDDANTLKTICKGDVSQAVSISCHNAGFTKASETLSEGGARFFMFANQLPILDLALDQQPYGPTAITPLELRPENDLYSDEAYIVDLLASTQQAMGTQYNLSRIAEDFQACARPDKSQLDINLARLEERLQQLASDIEDAGDTDTLAGHREILSDLHQELKLLLPYYKCWRYEDILRGISAGINSQNNSADVLAWTTLSYAQTRSWARQNRISPAQTWHWFAMDTRIRQANSYIGEGLNDINKGYAQDSTAGAIAGRAADILSSRLELVAFSDRNDILSYEFPQYYEERFGHSIDLINVPIRLKRPILPVKGPYGLFADPLGAHLNHKYSADILDLMLCGVGEDGNFETAMENCETADR